MTLFIGLLMKENWSNLLIQL